MAAVAPVPSIAYPAPAASNFSSAADDSSLTSARSKCSKLSASLAALDLHSPHLPSRRDEASVSSKSVRRRDVIRSMGPVQLADGVAEGMKMPGPAALVTPGPMASPGTTASLVLAPQRKLVPPGSKSPYSYVHSYAVDSFHSKDTGALVLPPLGYPALKNHAHGDSVTDGSPTSVAEGPPSIQGEGPVMLDAAGVAHPVEEGALVPHDGEARPRVNSDPIMLDSGGVVHDVNEGAMVEHTHPNGRGAMVVHEGSNPDNQQLVPHNLEEEMIPGEHPLVREHRLRHRRGRDPDEVVRDRTLIPYDGPADPPGESPSDHPIALGGCTELAVHGGDCEGSQYSGMDNNNKGRFRQVRWVDPKNVKEEGQIDYAILGQYEELTSLHRGYDHAHIGGAELIPSTNSRAIVPIDPPSQPTALPNAIDDPALLLSNPRTRIATVSSGYKKANFFVREDLDTRIYFHQLEDAVGYMAKRGYARMPKEEEGEWRELLGRAHGVVKKGTKKEKQRYRKGKLVLILKKTILDHDDDEDGKRKARSSRRKIRAMLEDASSRASASVYSGSEGTQTTRTSLGRSVRGPYKSYSEKFLAEQEENKRQYLLAITEGRPLPDVGYGNEDRLMLTAEGGGSTTKGGDPDALSSQDVSTRASFDETTQGGTTTAHSRSRQELMKSESALSDRKGVYGGGVRYFTPDNVDDDDSEDETTEDEDFEEEESDYTEDEDEDETTEGGTYDEEEATEDGDTATYDAHTAHSGEEYTEVSASDMGSMFSQEDETYDYTKSGGVESVDGSTDSRSEAAEEGRGDRSSTAKHGASGRGRRGPPRMEPISDDSASSNSRC